MKIRIVGLLAVASLILAFAFIAEAPAAPHKANVPATPAASALPATPAASAAEPHPQIREALAALRRAKAHMEHAAHDFGGHRVEAIEATKSGDQATGTLFEVRQGLSGRQVAHRFLKVQKSSWRNWNSAPGFFVGDYL